MKKSKVAKKTVKTVKRRKYGKRSPKLVIPIVNLVRNAKGGAHIRVTKHGIFFNPEHAAKLDVIVGDYLFLGVTGEEMYLGKKPKGVFGGHVIVRGTSENSMRMGIKGNFEEYKVIPGDYTLSDKSIPQVVSDPEGKQIPFEFLKLEAL